MGLGLQLMSHVIPGRTAVLPLGDGRIVPHNTGYVLSGICLMVVKGDVWALAEICALLNAQVLVSVSVWRF